jgi:folate-binding protein YgfZ
MSLLDPILTGRMALPLAPRAVWKLTGPDRIRFLNGQVTQDITKLQPGHAVHAAVTQAKGRMEGDVWITATPDAHWIDAPGSLRASLGTRIERYLIADNVVLEDVSDSWCLFHVLGAVDDPRAIASARFFLPGHDLWLPSGTPPDRPLASAELQEIFRIHQTVPLWDRDMGLQTLPPEAALERDAISYNKGCYIGQEVIARIKSVGHVNKRLARFSAPTSPVPPLPAELVHEGKPAGYLTSVCVHPEGNGLIGLGTVRRELAETGGLVTLGNTIWTIHAV